MDSTTPPPRGHTARHRAPLDGRRILFWIGVAAGSLAGLYLMGRYGPNLLTDFLLGL